MSLNALSADHLKALAGLVPPERISTGQSVLGLHARDQSPHPARRPQVVIFPAAAAEVAAVLKYADSERLAVTGWGAGSSLEGNPIPVAGGIVIDFSQMNRVLGVRAEDFQADVQPGVIYQDLNAGLRHSGLFFPPDPGARATIGGMIANNASGTRTVLYGSTRDHVLRLKVALAGGEIIELGTRASKSSSGYDLLHLFTGSEGTLGLVVEATLRLVGLPAEYSAAVATFPAVAAAARAVYELKRSGLNPAALELLGPECIPLMNADEHLDLAVAPTLFIEFHGATLGQLAEALETAEEICRAGGGLEFRRGLGRTERDGIFKARHGLYEMIVRRHPHGRILVMDLAVPLTAYPELLAAMQAELAASGLPGYVMSHAGNGNVHLDLIAPKDDAGLWALVQEVAGRLVHKALALGGTSTGEHGVGLGKRKYMAAEHGTSLPWMRRVKALFDPNGILNPGKIFPDA